MQPEHFITSHYFKGAMAGHQSLVTRQVHGRSLSGAMELRTCQPGYKSNFCELLMMQNV